MNRTWAAGELVHVDAELATVATAYHDLSTIAWLHVTPAELVELAERLHLHPTAVEDAISRASGGGDLGQRTKVDRYPDHLFCFVYKTWLSSAGDLLITPIPVFVSKSWLITIDRPPAEGEEPLGVADMVARWQGRPELLSHGSAALLYGLLDMVVDSHLRVADELADRVDMMEDLLFSDDAANLTDDPRELQRAAFATRKSLVRLRRIAVPMREMITGAMRRDEDDATPVDQHLMPFYQDIYDHVLRVNDTLDGLRDLLTTIYETRLAMADHTLNTVTKKLAAWAAIIAVPTAVTGFFGQNVPYPGFGDWTGFVVSTAMWGGASGVLYVIFRAKRWL